MAVGTGRVVGMGVLKILERFSGADTVGPPNVGNVWKVVDDIDSPQSVCKQQWALVGK